MRGVTWGIHTGAMNLNQFAALCIAGATVAGAAAGIFGFRYAPIQGNGLDMVTLWDRWEQRVCVVVMARDNRPTCSVEALTR